MNFCNKCGNRLAENLKFCTACGTPVGIWKAGSVHDVPMHLAAKPALQVQCPGCGASAPGSLKFCTKCGGALTAPVAPASSPGLLHGSSKVIAGIQSANAAVHRGNSLMSSAALSLPGSGEVILDQSFSMAALAPITGPLSVIMSSARRIFTSLPAVIKDPKKLIPLLLITLVWLVLNLLPLFGINIATLNFLTFARSGANSGLFGILGGTVGKVFISYFVFSLLVPLLSGENAFSGMSNGFASFFKSFFLPGFTRYGSMVLGGGLALISYNFMTGDASWQNSLVGFLAAFMSIKALASQGGFLRRLLTSIAAKFNDGRLPDTTVINSTITGWGSGFVLAIPMAAFGISFLPYIAGAAGAVMGIGLLLTGRIVKA